MSAYATLVALYRALTDAYMDEAIAFHCGDRERWTRYAYDMWQLQVAIEREREDTTSESRLAKLDAMRARLVRLGKQALREDSGRDTPAALLCRERHLSEKLPYALNAHEIGYRRGLAQLADDARHCRAAIHDMDKAIPRKNSERQTHALLLAAHRRLTRVIEAAESRL